MYVKPAPLVPNTEFVQMLGQHRWPPSRFVQHLSAACNIGLGGLGVGLSAIYDLQRLVVFLAESILWSAYWLRFMDCMSLPECAYENLWFTKLKFPDSF
jgi:hypothetical protein